MQHEHIIHVMNVMNIFVDGSYSPQQRVGVGAYLIINSEDLKSLVNLDIGELKNILSNDIVYKTFIDAKGSTDVEQRILDIALDVALNSNYPEMMMYVYTDCKKTNSTDCYTAIHVKGHDKQCNRNETDKLFDVIDKAARKKLRNIIKETNYPKKVFK